MEIEEEEENISKDSWNPPTRRFMSRSHVISKLYSVAIIL